MIITNMLQFKRPETEKSCRTTARLRHRRTVRPSLEPLEGRALLAVALDPSFGTGGLVFGMTMGTDLRTVTATAVQSDGKILVAGSASHTSGSGSGAIVPDVAVRRYNTDGSVDTSFGTNGQVDIPVSSSATTIDSGPINIVVQSNGTIDLAATSASSTSSSSTITYNSLVAQLTSAGQLDPTFGTGGEYQFPTANDRFDAVAVQSNGEVVVAGWAPVAFGSANQPLLVDRLTTAGTLDTTFGTAGQATIPIPVGSIDFFRGLITAGVVINPSGQITVATNENYEYVAAYQNSGDLARFNSDGSVDTTFGTSGVINLGAEQINAIALQNGSNLIVAGGGGYLGTSGRPFLIRLLASGSTDSTFAGLPLNTSSPSFAGQFLSIAVGSTGAITVGGSLLADRFTANGAVDPSFGLSGRMVIPPPAFPGSSNSYIGGGFVALTPSNKVVIAGINGAGNLNRSLIAQLLPVVVHNPATNNFDVDNKSDFAVELTSTATYAYRSSAGDGDVLKQFGQPGAGNTIPLTGDFDGDGNSDIAVYLPSSGSFAYQPSSRGNDVLVQFGSAGPGASIPAPGDYFGTGTTAMAVYLPAQGAFAIRGPGGTGNVLVPFGVRGTGQSIPAPGDYDGDGIADLAVYIPSQGILAYRSTATGKDIITPFGSAGPGASIPAPGDYDGDGKTDVAVYLPASASFAIHPSSGAANYLIPFGMKGAGNSIPAPGDYDGDGKTDAAVYLPTLGLYAYRPSGGGGDVLQGFGTKGYGATIPAASIPYTFATSTSGSTGARGTGSVASDAVVYIPLTDEMTNPTVQKKTTGSA